MNRLLAMAVAAAALSMAGCDGGDTGNRAAEGASANAAGDAGNQTIAAGIEQNGRFFQAAKAVGLDATLGGSGPYTVLVPSDEAFAKVGGSALNDPANPDNRAALTRMLTYHILPGTMLVADIEKAVEAGEGRTLLPAMGGGTITVTREGGRLVLADSGGTKGAITNADQRFSNGVVHHIDTVLVPGEGDAPAAAAAPAQ